MAHADLVEQSLRSYIDQLDALFTTGARMSASTRAVARGARALTSNVLRLGVKYVCPHPPPLRVALVGAALGHADEAQQLVNIASLGLGSETPALIFIGKEAAAIAPRNFMLEMLALAALWRTGAPAELMSALLETSITFSSFPNAPTLLYGQQSAGHTWSTIDRLLRNVDLSLSIWNNSYVIDLGHLPERSHSRRSLVDARVDFLACLFRDFAACGTRVAVFHSQEPHHDIPQQRLIADFIGVAQGDLPRYAESTIEGYTRQERIEMWRHGTRSAVRCRHLSTGVPAGILDALTDTLRDALLLTDVDSVDG